MLAGTIKDIHGRNSTTILISPEQVKLFLLEDLKFIRIISKRNELEFINSHLENTLNYYKIGDLFYQKTVKYVLNDLLKEYLKDYPGKDYSRIFEN